MNVRVEMILPRWVDESRGTPGARTRWQDFHAALEAHEEGHRDIAFRAALTLLKHLQGARASSCLTLAEETRPEARRILDRYRTADRAYDARTNRGERQGVRWQP